VPEVAEHRLHRADALAVAPSSLGAVDALLHRLEQTLTEQPSPEKRFVPPTPLATRLIDPHGQPGTPQTV
jgi:hypothetical protein